MKKIYTSTLSNFISKPFTVWLRSTISVFLSPIAVSVLSDMFEDTCTAWNYEIVNLDVTNLIFHQSTRHSTDVVHFISPHTVVLT